VNEWNVAKALEALGLEYKYQVSIGGGRSRRGGQVVDFVVYRSTGPIAVFIQGAYWHNRASTTEDAIKMAVAKRMFGASAALGEIETKTTALAKRAVREKVGL
jgi:G:T-mismatch repair DNA endonuclease (very short patch repair protein)